MSGGGSNSKTAGGVEGGFPCPKCGHRTGVTDSRPDSNGGIRRRRRCRCGLRFTTREVTDDVISLPGSLATRLRVRVDRMGTLLEELKALTIAAEIHKGAEDSRAARKEPQE